MTAWCAPKSEPETRALGQVLLVPAQNTWLGKRVLNNFTWFYHSHLLMFVIFYIAAILHPWPGTPGYSHEHHHSVTWVRVTAATSPAAPGSPVDCTTRHLDVFELSGPFAGTVDAILTTNMKSLLRGSSSFPVQ